MTLAPSTVAGWFTTLILCPKLQNFCLSLDPFLFLPKSRAFIWKRVLKGSINIRQFQKIICPQTNIWILCPGHGWELTGNLDASIVASRSFLLPSCFMALAWPLRICPLKYVRYRKPQIWTNSGQWSLLNSANFKERIRRRKERG